MEETVYFSGRSQGLDQDHGLLGNGFKIPDSTIDV
jgi:hypothetical protein